MSRRKGSIRCPYCGRRARLISAYYIYKTIASLWYPKVWVCPDCEAYVGCRKGTSIPLGRLANAELREYKIKAHKSFDALWKVYYDITRDEAYEWLALMLDIPKEKCHIAMFDVDTCKKVIEICDKMHD